MRTPTCLLAALLLSAASAPASTFSVSGSGNSFTISRSGDTSAAETVLYRTVPLSAFPGQHYTAKSGTLAFAPGQTSTNITVSAASMSNAAYMYQTDASRAYCLEILDEGGFWITNATRSVSSGLVQFKADKVSKTVTDLVTFSGGSFSSGMSSDKYLDVAYSPPASYVETSGALAGYVLIDDSYDYAQKPAMVSTDTLIASTGATAGYLDSLGYKIYATVCFTEKERDDGYQYLQIVPGDVRVSYDTGADPNGQVNDPVNSVYKVCFELADGSNAEGKAFFPHRSSTGTGEFSLSTGKLWEQKYKDGYAAGSSGSVVLPATTAYITTRFDAGGNEDDTWGYKDFFVRMALVDDTYPTLYNDSTAAIGVGPGPYRKGNTFYISVPFNEIVYSSGTSKRIDTTWGSAYYDSGDGSNVITFKGTITASAGTVLEITGGTCNFRDLSYNYFQGSLNRTFNGKTVSASHAYPISYDLGGGTLPANAPTSYTYDAAVSLVQPTRMGYAFAGWTGSNGSTKQKYVTIYSGSYGPRSYVAHWMPITYTITYDFAGGALLDGESNPVTYAITNAAFTLANPVRTGYAFAGWTGTDLGGPTNEVTVATGSLGDRAYLAHWTTNAYAVRFHAYDGTAATRDQAFLYDAPQALDPADARTGYDFSRWTANADGSGDFYLDGQVVSNLTAEADGVFDLYAQWVGHSYIVRFDGNAADAVGSTDEMGMTYDVPDNLTSNGFSRTGYDFAGWSTSENGAVVYADGASVSNLTAVNYGSVTLYAQWTAHTYIVRFDANGGEGEIPDQSFTYDAPQTLTSSAFTRTGYDFAGWSTSEDGAVVYADGASVSNLTAEANGAIDLYAQWTAHTYTVRFDANGGEGTMPDQTFAYDAPQALSSNAFARTDYTFAGWRGADGTIYPDRATVLNLANAQNAVVSLTATWRVNIPYLDADGTERLCTDYTVIANATGEVAYGAIGATAWYVVTNAVTISGRLGFRGTVHLILCDGATLAVTNANGRAIGVGDLTIYGQTNGTGTVTANGSCGIDVGYAVTINGGTVTANGIQYGIFANNAVTINGGTVTANGDYGIYVKGLITLGWTNPTDSITANSYSVGVSVKTDQTLTDGTAIYKGNSVSPSAIARKTLVPAYGISLPEGVVASGVILQNDTTAYARPGDIVTLSAAAPGYAIGDVTVNGVPLEPVDGAYRFAADADNIAVNATLTTLWKILQAQLAAGGTVVLSRDITATAADTALFVPEGVAVTLDLAGHTLDRALADLAVGGETIRVRGSLALTNSVPASGAITGGNKDIDYESFSIAGGGGVYVEDGGAFTMTGGEISGNAAWLGGGGVSVADGGVFTMTGGAISGNSAGCGGGVYVGGGGAFTMTGGAISGNSAGDAGGGIFLEDGGAFAMSGGAISGNDAFSDGGGVLAYSDDGFAMSGGEISGNAARKNGGGVYLRTRFQAARLRISGALRVLGNVVTNFSDAAAPAAANDIDFSHADSLLQVVGDLAPGARLGIVPDVRRAVTTNLLGHAAGADGGLSLFFSDDPEYALALDDDGEICIVPPTYALAYAPQDHVAVSVWSVTNDLGSTATNVADLGLAPASFEAAYSPGEPVALRLDFEPGWFIDIEDEDYIRLTVAGSDENEVRTHGAGFDGTALYLVVRGPRAPATLALSLAPFSRTVTFQNVDGTVLQTGPVGYGIVPAYTNATPVLADPDERHYYVFSGWTPAPAPVLLDLDGASAAPVVYTAAYELRDKFAVVVDPNLAHGSVEVLLSDWSSYSAPVPAGTKLWLLPSVDPGYGVVSLSVAGTNGIPVEANADGSFTMPAFDVTVSATFDEALPIFVERDEAAQDAINGWSFVAGGALMDSPSAAPGAVVELDFYMASFLFAPNVAVATTNGAEVAFTVSCADEAAGSWTVRFMMPAEPVVVTISVVPATFDSLVLLPATNTVDAASRVFSFVPQETGVYRFALDDGDPAVCDSHAQRLFYGNGEASGALLAGETCYVVARVGNSWDWDGASRPLVAERTDGTFTPYAVAVDPDIAHGTVSTSLDSAPEYHPVYATPVPAPGYAYVEGSLRYIVGGVTNGCFTASDGTPFFQMPDDDVLVTAEFKPIPFAVAVDPDIAHGTVRVYVVTSGGGAGMLDEQVPYSGPVAVGTRISLRTSPDAGYGLVSRSIVDTNGVSIALDENGCFTMPASDVTVSATFAEALPISVRVDESAPDAISYWSVHANGVYMDPAAAVPGAAVEMFVDPASFLFAPTAAVTTASGAAVACEVLLYDESYGGRTVSFTMPAEPVVVSLSAVPATFDTLVLLPGTNIVDAASRVFSFVPQETGVYRFAMDDGFLGVVDCRGEYFFAGEDEASGALLAGETYYVHAVANDWDGTPRPLVAERTGGTFTLHSVAVAPDIAHGTVSTSHDSAPEYHPVYATPVPAPGYAYVEGSLRYIVGGETNELGSAPDGTPVFQMPAADVLVTAEFEPIPFAVTVDPDIEHGWIWLLDADFGMIEDTDPVFVGTKIWAYPVPDRGYGVVSLSVVDTSGAPVEVDEWGYFTMPASDVTVSATFAEALPITVLLDAAAQDAIDDWSVSAGGVEPSSTAAPGAAVAIDVRTSSFLLAPTAVVATTDGAEVPCETDRYDEASGEWYVRFTMPAEPVVVTLSAVPATFVPLVLLTDTNAVDAVSRVFSFVPEETGVYRFAMNGGHLSVSDCRGTYLFWGDDEASGVLLAGETCYVRAEINPWGWDGTPRSLVAERTDGTATLHSVAVDPDIAHGTVETSLASAPEGIYVYVTPVPAPGYDYVEGSLRYIVGGETNELYNAYDGTPCFQMPAADVVVTAEFEPRRYAVTVDPNIAHGTVGVFVVDDWVWSIYSGPVPAGTKIGLGASPDSGYGVAFWSVIDASGVPVAVDENGNFAMPASDVTVSATFAEALPITLQIDEFTASMIGDGGVLANGAYMATPAAVPGAEVSLLSYMRTFLLAPTAVVTTTNGAAVASEVVCLDEDNGDWAVSFTMPAEPVVVTLSLVPATFDTLVLLPGTNIVDAASRVFSFVPEETGVYRFAMEDGGLGVFGSRGEELFYGYKETSVTLLAGETYYVCADIYDWDGTPRPLVAERTGGTFTSYAVAVDPDIAHGTVSTSLDSAPEYHPVYATPVPAPGYAYVEGSLRYIVGGETNELYNAYDGTPCFQMPADDVLVTAEFEPIPFAVTVDPAVAHGSVDVWAAYGLMWSIYFDPVPVGTQMQLIVDPEPGYGFVSWSAVDTNGVPVEVDEDGYFAMPPSDVTVSATFAEALPISVRVDESAPDAISYWSVRANGVVMEPAAAVPGAAVEMFVCPASFVFAPTATVATASGAAVACEVLPYDESSVGRTVSFTMPAEPVVVSLSVVPATFDTLVLLPGTNTVDAESRVFSFVPEETGVYRFAMNGGHLSVSDCHGTYLFWGDDEASGTLLADETYYVRAEINDWDWDGTPRSLVAERTDGTVTLHSVAVDPDIAHGTVETSLASAPEGIYVYATPVPAPGWAYVEDSLRYICGGETNGLDSAPDGTPCFRMPADDVLVTAEFEPRRYAVAVDPAVAHGTVRVYEINGDNHWSIYTRPVLPGTGMGVRFEPDPGYGLVSWSVVDTNGVPVEVGEWGEFAMPASDVTVSAVVARTKSISVEEDEAAKMRIYYWQCYANDIYMDPAAAVPGAAVELSIGMQSFVFAPTATVATAGGAAIAATVERVNVLDYDGWSVRFTMPAEPVVVSLSAVPADYPALHEGVNVVDPPYRDRTFSFTPETTGYYSFVAAGSYYFGVVDSFEEGMGLPGTPGGMCSVPFLAGERYYVLYGESDGGDEHAIVVSMVGDPVATYAVAVDPSIAGGSVTPSVLRAAEGCRVHLAVAEDADTILGTLRATWTNGTETVELEIGEGTFGEAYFTMPAGDVAVTAEFPRARLLSVVTDAKTRLYHIFANERDYDDTASVKVVPNTEVAVVFWCPTGYELLVDVATAAGETVPSELDRDNCLTFTMPDAPVVATVSTVRKNLPALVVGDNAVDASAKTFSFAPSETAEYRFASENGYMQVFDDQGAYLEGERNSLSLVLLGGKTYFVGYSYQKTWDGTPKNLLVEKLETAVQLYRVSVDPDIVGGTVETSLTNAPRWHTVYLRPVPAPGYAYVEGSIAVRYGSDVDLPYDNGGGTFSFSMPDADVVVTALFDPVPFAFPPYLAGADDTVLTNYVRWAAVHGPDVAGTQEASFLLDADPAAPVPDGAAALEVAAFGATADGWRLELASGVRDLFQPAGLEGTSYLCNGVLVLEAAEDLASLTNAPANLRAAPASIEGSRAVLDLPATSAPSLFLRPSIRSLAPSP